MCIETVDEVAMLGSAERKAIAAMSSMIVPTRPPWTRPWELDMNGAGASGRAAARSFASTLVAEAARRAFA